MSVDRVDVAVAASNAGFQPVMEQSAAAVESATASMGSDFEAMGARITAAVEGAEHRLEHFGVAAAFAMQGLANDTETGVSRALHSLAFLGFAFGDPLVGAVTTGLALALDQIIKFANKAGDEIEKARKKFEDELEKWINAGDVAQMQKKAQDLWVGTPGKAFADGIVNLQKASKGFHDLLDPAGKYAEFLKKDLYDQMVAVDAELQKQTTEFNRYRQAILDTQNVPLRTQGLLPTVSTGENPDNANKDLSKIYDEEGKALDKALKEFQDSLDKRAKATEKADEEWKKHELQTSTEFTATQIKYFDDVSKANEAMLKKMGEDHDKRVKEIEGQWKSVFGVINSTVQKSFDGVIQGTLTLQQAFTNMFRSFVLESAQATLRWLEDWTAKHLAAEGVSAASAAKEVLHYAAVAAAGAWSAIAGIPVVGPVLAPAAAAAALAGVIALAESVKSAEGGYDIPVGTNPLTQLHGGEMVLPKEHADTIRSLGDGGGGGGTMIVYAMDSQSFEDFAYRNAATFAKAGMKGMSSKGVTPINSAGRRGGR